MSKRLSPLTMLAMSMQAQPGVYALLLGSGVSTGAGIPTGWGIVKDLIRRAAAIEDPASVQDAVRDPEEWWRRHHGGQLGYSSLLEAVAPAAATRQGLLANFFEPSDEEREQGIKTPSNGHLAIAQLVKRGSVKVIVTTNFDRLVEKALDAAGIAPQVIARPEAVNGMKPLAHAPATVIKIHGDYLDLGSRNTPAELDQYPEEWKTLLARVFDEYGLIISGWSAEWDTALVRLFESAPNRRYPLYWDARSSKGATARRLLEVRSGQIIPAAGADEMFGDLASALETLDRLAEPPLTTAMAVARLKRYLPNPVRRLDLHDLVMGATEAVAESIKDQPLSINGLDATAYQAVLDSYREQSSQLCALLVAGVWHDLESTHVRLWMDVLEHLLQIGSARHPGIPSQDALARARLYPALLVQTTLGVAATRRRRDELLIKLALDATGTVDIGERFRVPACQAVHPYRVVDARLANKLPRWGATRGGYPLSRLPREDVRHSFKELIPDESDYADTFRDYEYRMSLLHQQTNTRPVVTNRAIPGEYAGEQSWYFDGEEIPLAEKAFRDAGERHSNWPWVQVLGGTQQYEQALLEHRDFLRHLKDLRRL